MTLKALIFGACVDWRTGVAGAIEAEFAAKGIEIDGTEVADAWRAEYQPAMEGVRSGVRGYLQLDDLHLGNLHRVLSFRDRGDVFDEAELIALNQAWERLPPWPDVVPGLSRLKDRFIIAPCSNGSIALITGLAKNAGLPWDCFLGADVARAYKPDPLVYRMSVAALRLATAEAMMVAAHNDDLTAARAEGLKTAFVPRPTEHGPDQTTDLEPAQNWDVIATDFEDLAAQLAA